jgi:hypothetical protein
MLSEHIRRIQITDTMTDEEALAFREQHYVLLHSDKKRLGIRTMRNQGALIKPDGSLLLVLLKDILDPELRKIAYEQLRQVNGDPSNRPEIIGKGASMLDVNKDGMIGLQNRVPTSVMKAYGGKTDFLGYYRYKNPAPGVVHCDVTGWTKSRPDIYIAVMPWIQEINKVYQTFLPEEYAIQKAYVDRIPEGRKIPKTAFTTLYLLKNAPTACHTDDMDIREGFGCMASLGLFSGSEIAFLKYKVCVDYQPTDVILADVHEVHGNFPLTDGERVSCVFFCREGQHECPTP